MIILGYRVVKLAGDGDPAVELMPPPRAPPIYRERVRDGYDALLARTQMLYARRGSAAHRILMGGRIRSEGAAKTRVSGGWVMSPEEKTLPVRATRLIQQLGEGDAYHLQTAAEELASLGLRDVRIQLALEKAASDDAEKNVREAAYEALGMLDYRQATAEQRAT